MNYHYSQLIHDFLAQSYSARLKLGPMQFYNYTSARTTRSRGLASCSAIASCAPLGVYWLVKSGELRSLPQARRHLARGQRAPSSTYILEMRFDTGTFLISWPPWTRVFRNEFA